VRALGANVSTDPSALLPVCVDLAQRAPVLVLHVLTAALARAAPGTYSQFVLLNALLMKISGSSQPV